MRPFRLAALPVFVLRVHRDGRMPPPEGPFDVLVVPGARVRDDGSPSTALLRRMDLGIELFRQGLADRLLLTGRGPGPVPEADWMARIARDAGIAQDALDLERHAMTTAENALYASRVRPARRVLVVTDDTHVRRCVREFARHYPEVHGVGAPTSGRTNARNLLVEALKEAWRGR
ncbi:MAG: YdcF family protein [Alphaproteobacteria bacterium]|nr:YdcF family protein [Alphaproteobacteria bacterium]MCB9690540.1 YdcF family protein [Alphaproteobacteria bacterium]